MKKDIADFRKAASQAGLTEEQRQELSRWLHAAKRGGGAGTANAKGDFTWDELVALIQDFKKDRGL